MKMLLSYFVPPMTTDLFHLLDPCIRLPVTTCSFLAFSSLLCNCFLLVDALPSLAPCPLVWALTYVDLLLAWFLLEFPTFDQLSTYYVLLYNVPRVIAHRLVCVSDSRSALRSSQHGD